MKAKRRRHDPEFKARVALEALKGVQTIQQIAKDFDIHPVQVSDWKKAMTAGASGVFGAARLEKGRNLGFRAPARRPEVDPEVRPLGS